MIYDTMKQIMDDDTVSNICIILCGLLFSFIYYLIYTILYLIKIFLFKVR